MNQAKIKKLGFAKNATLISLGIFTGASSIYSFLSLENGYIWGFVFGVPFVFIVLYYLK